MVIKMEIWQAMLAEILKKIASEYTFHYDAEKVSDFFWNDNQMQIYLYFLVIVLYV